MADITHGAWIKDGKAVDAVYQGGVKVYSRNLVIGTSNQLKTITGSGWGVASDVHTSGTYGAGKYYASAYIENTTPVALCIWVHVNGVSYNVPGSFIQAGESGISSYTFNVLEGQSLDSMHVGFRSLQTESYTYKYKEVMIKRTPSSWSPAPEDVLN